MIQNRNKTRFAFMQTFLRVSDVLREIDMSNELESKLIQILCLFKSRVSVYLCSLM